MFRRLLADFKVALSPLFYLNIRRIPTNRPPPLHEKSTSNKGGVDQNAGFPQIWDDVKTSNFRAAPSARREKNTLLDPFLYDFPLRNSILTQNFRAPSARAKIHNPPMTSQWPNSLWRRFFWIKGGSIRMPDLEGGRWVGILLIYHFVKRGL